MNPIPFDLPVNASEAAALASLVFEHAEGREVTDDVRGRVAGRAALLSFESMRPYLGSLERDPVHPSTFYVAADGQNGQPLLLHIAPGSAPASGLFPKSLLIGRLRLAGSREVVINAIPFASTDHENIRTFAEQVNRAFLPRPQGSQPAIAAGNRHPEISLPAVFDAYRTILKNTGINMASTVQLSATREMTTDEALAARDGENPTAPGHTRVSIQHLYHAGLWAAIRAGWRHGYNAEADHFIVSGNSPDEIARSVEATKEAIRQASGYTKFTTDTSRLFVLEADPRHPAPWSNTAVAEKFDALFSQQERRWIVGEFVKTAGIGDSSYEFTHDEVMRLAVKFGESLKLNEQLHDFIRQVKSGGVGGRAFDFEPSIDEAETLTTPRELIFYMQWLKLRGRAAHLVPPNLGFKKRQAYPETMDTLRAYVAHKMWPELEARVAAEFGGKPLEELAARVRELAAVARHFQGTLSIHSGSGKQAAVLQAIGRAALGRVNYKISGELQLQLLDVLSEQTAGSPWRALFDRMAERANQFAAQGAFGAESELARKYPWPYLGKPEIGRVDGNLFLVFWLGNMVGSRDTDGRFFKEKLDELPADLVAEVRHRNTQYVVWLAENLIG